MSDLLIFPTDDSRSALEFQDGDIIIAFNEHRRKAKYCRAAWRLVARRTSDGEWQGGGIHEELVSVYHEAKFEVISSTEVRVTRRGYSPYVVGPVPRESPLGRMEHIALKDFLRARRSRGKKLFREGRAIRWYGAEQARPPLSRLQPVIDELSAEHSIDLPTAMRWGPGERRNFLAITVDDFDFAVEKMLESPVYEPGDMDPETGKSRPVLVAKRRNAVRWRKLTNMTAHRVASVLNKNDDSDLRKDLGAYLRESIVEEKVRR